MVLSVWSGHGDGLAMVIFLSWWSGYCTKKYIFLHSWPFLFVIKWSACFETYNVQHHFKPNPNNQKSISLIDFENWFCTFKLWVSQFPNFCSPSDIPGKIQTKLLNSIMVPLDFYRIELWVGGGIYNFYFLCFISCFDGRHPLMKDNHRWKTTLDERQPKRGKNSPPP